MTRKGETTGEMWARLGLLVDGRAPARRRKRRSGADSKANVGKWSRYETMFWQWCQAQKDLPLPTPQVQFHNLRNWALDFAWPELKIAVELHGGQSITIKTKSGDRVRTGGRHNRKEGFAEDREKMNSAIEHGYRVFELSCPEQCNPTQFERIKKAVQAAQSKLSSDKETKA
jgi:very-short-patch-repair endonuclease